MNEKKKLSISDDELLQGMSNNTFALQDIGGNELTHFTDEFSQQLNKDFPESY